LEAYINNSAKILALDYNNALPDSGNFGVLECWNNGFFPTRQYSHTPLLRFQSGNVPVFIHDAKQTQYYFGQV
jgi:hypothetical protein